MREEKLEYKGYIAKLIYQPIFDNSTPKSQQYRLIIIKDDIELINQYRFTYNGAITFFHGWVDKKTL